MVKADDDVAVTQPTFPCRTIVFERDDQDPTFDSKTVEPHYPAGQWNVLSRQPDITATNFTVTNQTAGNKLGCVNRGGEADALCRQNHCGIDADHLAS